ncbi:hypothetical protein MR988_06540 [bacterium]|nr:hypothetical protein [bacterium]
MKKLIIFISIISILMTVMLCSCNAYPSRNSEVSNESEQESTGIIPANKQYQGEETGGYEKIELKNSYGNLANDCQRQIYDEIKNQCLNITHSKREDGELYTIDAVKCPENTEKRDIKIAFNAFKNDNPRCFWISTACVISESPYFGSSLYLLSLYSPEETAEREQKFTDKIDEVLNEMPVGITPYERELYLHNFLIENCQYEDGALDVVYGDDDYMNYCDCFNAYGALINGKAVCQGYAELYSCLLSRAGINNALISSKDHVWNAVELENQWYNVDVTWDDTANTNRYFNLSQPLFSCDHTAAPMYWEMTDEQILGDSENFGQWFNTFIPNCDGEKYLGVQV